MTKLYDVFLVSTASWRVGKREVGANQFQMRAPLSVISQIHRLHPTAEQRIVRETEANGFCDLHKNGEVWIVKLPSEPLGIEMKE